MDLTHVAVHRTMKRSLVSFQLKGQVLKTGVIKFNTAAEKPVFASLLTLDCRPEAKCFESGGKEGKAKQARTPLRRRRSTQTGIVKQNAGSRRLARRSSTT